MARLGRVATALGASLAVGLGLGTATAAYADPTPLPATSVGPRAVAPKATGDNAHTLSPQDLRQQIAAAEALRADLLRSNAQIAAATTRLERLSLQANKLLEEYAAARDAERAAREEANRNVKLFEVLSTQVNEDRRALGEWAYHAYAGGGTLGEMQALIEVLGRPAEEASDTAAQLSYLSDQRTGAYLRVRDHAALQRDVAARAVEASARATEEAAKAAEARRKLDGVIKDQKAQLESTRELYADQVAKVGPIAGVLLGSENAAARAATKRLHQAMASMGFGIDGSTETCSDDEAEYPNGHVPARALCPLYGDPSQMLRPSAAAGFNALSKAYERDTGSPICVTDSYRSYAEQVSVKASRGKWAASPGTSEHGMGRALDLCGGINDFGSPAHLWMKQNAPLYGWFHPAWAEPEGALPEPWHWEYAG
jgi:hypothetical protein